MGEQIEKEVDIVKLWRWIKYIIKEMRILNEKCNDVENNRRGVIIYNNIYHITLLLRKVFIKNFVINLFMKIS